EVRRVRPGDVERPLHDGLVREDPRGELKGLLEDPEDDQADLASLPVCDDDRIAGGRTEPAPRAHELARARRGPVADRVRSGPGESPPHVLPGDEVDPGPVRISDVREVLVEPVLV